MIKKGAEISVPFLFVIFSILSQVFFPIASSADEFRVSYPVSEVSVTRDAKGYANFSGTRIHYRSQGGTPALPYRAVRVLLPPDADLKTVSISAANEQFEDIPGYWEVRPTLSPVCQDGERWPSGYADYKDRMLNTGYVPENLMAPASGGRIHQYQILEIPVALFQYHPSSCQLRRLTHITFIITYQADPENPSFPETGHSDRMATERVKAQVVNFSDVFHEYPNPANPRSSLEKPGYTIITTRSIASDSIRLSEFVRTKKERGFDVQVITEEAWGGGIGDPGAENIREWLKRNHADLRIHYLLLIGDPDPEKGDVPMKMLWPRSNAAAYPEHKECPSDYYYADLTGNWDMDGDGRYGEWRDDFGPGGVDRNHEIVVGRIPCYGSSADDLDSILKKIIAYQNASDISWRKNVLLPMNPSDEMTPGYHLGEAIRDDLLIPKYWDAHRVYDDDYDLFPQPEATSCDKNSVSEAWIGSRFGAVFWWSHGKETVAENVMDRYHAAMLDDASPAFTFQASCFNSCPENSRNLSYTLLRNGAVSSVGATRVSWYYPGEIRFKGSNSKPGMAYEYARRLIGEDMSCGDALHEMKASLTPTETLWMNFTAFCLYGDPELSLTSHAPGSAEQNEVDGGPEAGEDDEKNRKPEGISPASPGYSDLRIGAVIHTEEKGPAMAVWRKGGENTTEAGHHVIWGHFYASPDDVAWGDSQNPEVFVKIWLDAGGRTDVNFFHVSVPDITVYSEMPGDEARESMLSLTDQKARHEY